MKMLGKCKEPICSLMLLPVDLMMEGNFSAIVLEKRKVCFITPFYIWCDIYSIWDKHAQANSAALNQTGVSALFAIFI